MKLRLKNFIGMTLLLLAMLSLSAHAQFWSKKKTDLLPELEAFQVSAIIEGDQLRIDWLVADDYYMYRDQFGVSSNTPGAEFGDLVFPEGVVEQDPEFGEVVVYFNFVSLTAPINNFPTSGNEIALELTAQGCNKPVGVCYPPQIRKVVVDFEPALANSTGVKNQANNSNTQPPATEQTLAATQQSNKAFQNQTQEKTFWAYVIAAFGAGILLSFTPCVLPMIPILAGVIAGQKNPSQMRSGWLAVCYVAGTIVTYAIAGWIAGASGTQLQAHFQSPLVIGTICTLLVVLASSLFGAFKIELPSSVQSKLVGAEVKSSSASFSSFALGLISALIVGACVSPILILSLGAAISKGDPVLGSAIMSAMALGMGSLLILFGFGAGWILPKTGAWMKQIQVLFGFMVLGVAIYIASFNAAVPALLLWAALLLWTGFYFWQLSKQTTAALAQSVFQATSIGIVAWGIMSLIGASTGGSDILKPLSSLSFSQTQAQTHLPFNKITTQAQAQTLLQQAKQNGKPVLVDFYADWCLDCKRMQRTTFTEASVHSALQDWVLIEADVTTTNSGSEALKQFFDVFGPPATLFIRGDGSEHQNLRQYGYMNKDDFLTIIGRAQP